MSNNFLKVDYDKFESKTVTTMKGQYGTGIDFNANLRHVSMPGVDSLALDLDHRGSDWFYLKLGNLTININDVENIVLEPHEIPQPPENYNNECAWYELDQNLLKKICDAKSIDFKISGETKYKIANENRFIYYAQMFYNSFYEEVYKEPEVAYAELLIKREEHSKGYTFSDDERVRYREYIIKELNETHSIWTVLSDIDIAEGIDISNRKTTSSTASNSSNGCMVALLIIGALFFCFIRAIF